jgi:ATP-dependent helicase/nuclease subunit A
LNEQKNYGNILHAALSKITSINDIESAMETLFIEGLINEAEKILLTQKISDLIQHHDINGFFEIGLNIKNEAEIILQNGETIRPDRIILKDEQIIVIDYKTGRETENHKLQLEKYAEALLDMGYKNVEKYLIYTEEMKVEKL